MHTCRQLLCDPRLPHSGLTYEQDHLKPACYALAPVFPESFEDLVTARERQPTTVEDRRETRVQRFGRLAEWTPQNLARLQWLGETLQLQTTQFFDFVASPTTGKDHHQFGTANRGRICRRFQPLGLDDCQSEAVVSFERDIADGDADANLQPLTTVTAIRQIDHLLIATAAPSARAELVKVAIRPSPRCLTTCPPFEPMISPSRESWVLRSASAASSPTCVRSAVDPRGR